MKVRVNGLEAGRTYQFQILTVSKANGVAHSEEELHSSLLEDFTTTTTLAQKKKLNTFALTYALAKSYGPRASLTT